MEARLKAWLESPQGQRLRARLEEFRPHAERAARFARELPPRDWAGIVLALAALLFAMRFSRAMDRQTRLLERQTDILESSTSASASDREALRQVSRARLRAALWRIHDLLRPAALKEASLLPPDRRGALVREARLVLEEGELNPALMEDPESSAAWRSALAAARLAEETAAQPGSDANFFLTQAERVHGDLMTVRGRLAPESVEPAAPAVALQPSPAPTAPQPDSSPAPKPAAGMQR